MELPDFDDDAAKRIIESALRDRCRDGAAAPAAAAVLWLDLSSNCIKRPESVVQKMEVGGW